MLTKLPVLALNYRKHNIFLGEVNIYFIVWKKSTKLLFRFDVLLFLLIQKEYLSHPTDKA